MVREGACGVEVVGDEPALDLAPGVAVEAAAGAGRGYVRAAVTGWIVKLGS